MPLVLFARPPPSLPVSPPPIHSSLTMSESSSTSRRPPQCPTAPASAAYAQMRPLAFLSWSRLPVESRNSSFARKYRFERNSVETAAHANVRSQSNWRRLSSGGGSACARTLSLSLSPSLPHEYKKVARPAAGLFRLPDGKRKGRSIQPARSVEISKVMMRLYSRDSFLVGRA